LADDAVKLTDEQVEPFVGQYRCGILSVTVSRDGSQLARSPASRSIQFFEIGNGI
jgi:hypothetical protein